MLFLNSFMLSNACPKPMMGVIEKGAGQASSDFALPTANLSGHELPQAAGVYCVYADIEGRRYPGLCFLGRASLLPQKPWRAEVHLLGYEGPLLYGKQAVITFERKIRDAVEFTSREQAGRMIADDLSAAKAYFIS
jgi:riboflavin kinase/FMN adenylyltransferase